MGMQVMIFPGFALRHARTVDSWVSALVKSHLPSNKAIPRSGRVASTLSRCWLSRGGLFGWSVEFGFWGYCPSCRQRCRSVSGDAVRSCRSSGCRSSAPHFSCPFGFKGMESRPPRWGPCSRPHPRSSSGPPGACHTVRCGFIKIRMKVVNFIKKIFIKNHFHQKPLSSETTFIKNHFHQNHFHQNHFDQNPLSSRTIFIKNHFHQKPLSSKTTFIKNHFHQKPFSSKTTFIKNHFHQKTPNPKDLNPTDLNPEDLRARSTSANYDFGQLFFSSSANSTSNNFDFGQFRLRPISISANFDFGQFRFRPIFGC